MSIFVDAPIRVTKGDRATIGGTGAQVEKWRQKRRDLGLTDAQLLALVLPMLDQIQGGSNVLPNQR